MERGSGLVVRYRSVKCALQYAQSCNDAERVAFVISGACIIAALSSSFILFYPTVQSQPFGRCALGVAREEQTEIEKIGRGRYMIICDDDTPSTARVIRYVSVTCHINDMCCFLTRLVSSSSL